MKMKFKVYITADTPDTLVRLLLTNLSGYTSRARIYKHLENLKT